MSTTTTMEQPPNLYSILEVASYSRAGMFVYPPGNIGTPHYLSYCKLLVSAKHKARLLHGSSAAKDQRIILLHFDSHMENIEWLWATLVAGFLPAISTPFVNDFGQKRKHLLHLNSTLENPLILTTARLRSEFLDIESLSIHTIEDLQTEYNFMNGTHHPFDYLTDTIEREDIFRGAYAEPSDTAVLMLTSGSSGYAKAVRLRHDQMIKAVKGKAEYHGNSSDTVFLNWIGMDHVANLTEIHLHAMSLGAHQVHVDAADLLLQPSTFVSLLSKHQVAYIFAPNFFLAALRKSLENPASSKVCENADLSPLRALISGGEANVVDTCDAVTRLLRCYGVEGEVIRPGFGMTETCAGSIYNKSCPLYELERGLEYGCLGSCIPGTQMRVVLGDGSIAAPAEVGHLQVRGSIVFELYPDEQRRA